MSRILIRFEKGHEKINIFSVRENVFCYHKWHCLVCFLPENLFLVFFTCIDLQSLDVSKAQGTNIPISHLCKTAY